MLLPASGEAKLVERSYARLLRHIVRKRLEGFKISSLGKCVCQSAAINYIPNVHVTTRVNNIESLDITTCLSLQYPTGPSLG